MVAPRVVIVGQHRFHEVLLLAWSLIFGVSGLWRAPAPGSLTALVPHWEVQTWSALLAVSGIVGLPGYLGRRHRGGLLLELAGMLAGAGALAVYCIAIILTAGWRGAFGAGLISAWAVANMLRGWQIRTELKGWR